MKLRRLHTTTARVDSGSDSTDRAIDSAKVFSSMTSSISRSMSGSVAGMDQHPDTWTAEGVKGGLIGFYREIAEVGLLFPRADRPIAVEFPGYPVVRLRPIDGLEFVEEAVTALGSSTSVR
jgi:hypothetical protein